MAATSDLSPLVTRFLFLASRSAFSRSSRIRSDCKTTPNKAWRFFKKNFMPGLIDTLPADGGTFLNAHSTFVTMCKISNSMVSFVPSIGYNKRQCLSFLLTLQLYSKYSPFYREERYPPVKQKEYQLLNRKQTFAAQKANHLWKRKQSICDIESNPLVTQKAIHL